MPEPLDLDALKRRWLGISTNQSCCTQTRAAIRDLIAELEATRTERDVALADNFETRVGIGMGWRSRAERAETEAADHKRALEFATKRYRHAEAAIARVRALGWPDGESTGEAIEAALLGDLIRHRVVSDKAALRGDQ